MIEIRSVAATRYVAPLREGGSLPGLMEADDFGTYVVKFRGAGQGVKTLIAELITGEIARLIDLPVPEIVFVELDPILARAEPDPDIQDLLAASGGLNLALDFLPGSLAYSVAMQRLVDPDLAARVVWLDALTTNIDRTPRNPNLLIWHRNLWLIDHGASLYSALLDRFCGPRPHAVPADRRARSAPDRLLDPRGRPALRPKITEDAIGAVVEAIPDDWLHEHFPFPTASDLRGAYIDLIQTRLSAADAFEAEAEQARLGRAA